MMEATPILEIRNLQIRRGGVLQLDLPALSIKEGEILALIGPNGAGKTTLLQAISHLIGFSQGDILFRGQKVNSKKSVLEYRRKLAMVFQEPLLFDTTVFENVASGLKIRGTSASETQSIVARHLNLFGISQLSPRSARTLSGGEAQRTSLARAFAIGPEVLFLDEPFMSLDPPSRESLMDDLERILRETGTTTIFATHDRLEALRLADRIAVMNFGRIVQIGTPREVMNQPVNEFVASFVGVETILAGKVVRKDGGTFVVAVSGHEIEVVGGVETGEVVRLCIRPENVVLSTHLSEEATSARNIFQGKITKTTPMGFFHRVQVDCGFPLVAYVTHHSLNELSLVEGKDVKASFKATAIHFVRKGEK